MDPKQRLEAITVKLLNDASALRDERMRRNLLRERLAELTPHDIALLLEGIYRKAQTDHGARRLVYLLVDPGWLKDALGAEKYGSVYHASISMGLLKVSRLFTELPPRRTGIRGYDKEEEARMEFLTLGQRRALARRSVKDNIDRLLSDPDPVVIQNLLNNPRLTEREAVKIASKRPNSPEILKLLTRHSKWSKRYAVKKAIANNPYASPRTAIGLLDMLLTQDLAMISQDSTLHQQVRLTAGEIVTERSGEETGGEGG